MSKWRNQIKNDNSNDRELSSDDANYVFTEVDSDKSIYEVTTTRNGKNYELTVIALTEEEFERATSKED